MKAFAVAAILVMALNVPADAAASGDDAMARGGSYRSAKSGRFVTKGYGKAHKPTTIRNGKY